MNMLTHKKIFVSLLIPSLIRVRYWTYLTQDGREIMICGGELRNKLGFWK